MNPMDVLMEVHTRFWWELGDEQGVAGLLECAFQGEMCCVLCVYWRTMGFRLSGTRFVLARGLREEKGG